MKPYIIYQVMKADLLERVRRSSFLTMCIFAMFLAFFSVPDVEAPLVSICMEPGIFSQGSNPSWMPIAIALCGGVLFPMIGFVNACDLICPIWPGGSEWRRGRSGHNFYAGHFYISRSTNGCLGGHYLVMDLI